MAGPTDRRRIGRVLAGVIREHGARIDVDALSDELAESLIPANYLERFGRAIVDSAHDPVWGIGHAQAVEVVRRRPDQARPEV